MSNLVSFRSWLRRRRQEHGLTQEDLGELVGYAAQTIAKIEGGQRRPSPQLALRLAEALQIGPDEQPAWMRAALAGDESASPAPPAEPLRQPTPSLGLPAYLTPFLGREREQAELAALLARPDCRLVTLLGPGGAGKTRLAIETSRALPGFADGVAFVALAPVTAHAAIVSAIGDALGLAFSGAGELFAQLIAHLRERRVLLILDNLEQLLDPAGAAAELLERLLTQAAGVSVLATSRERLRLAGEWVLELEGLPLPPPQAAAESQTAPALRLFAEHAERVERGFRLSAANTATVTTICRMVDGLPLGIELAAAWLRLLPLEAIAGELERGLEGAEVSSRTLPARHHSLRAVVAHSWELLRPEERATLRRLAVFQGGFTRETAAEVAGATLATLAALVDKSLLRRGAAGRYSLHELIRQYAAARLAEQPEEEETTRARHAACFVRLAGERAERIKGSEQAAATAELAAEIDNIRPAWIWAVRHGPHDDLVNAGEALRWFYEFRSWLQEGAALFADGVAQLRQAGPGDDTTAWRLTLGRLLGNLGYLSTRTGAFDAATAAMDESEALLTEVGDAVGLARTLVSRAQLAYWIGDFAYARRLSERSLALSAATASLDVRAMGQTAASMAAHAVGDLAAAESLFRAALAAWRELGNPRGTIWCITSCCPTLLALGDHNEAQQLLRESLALSSRANDAGGTAMTLYNLGWVALEQDDHEAAIYFLREALPMVRVINSMRYAHMLNQLGSALWQTGAAQEAQRCYAEALAAALQAHDQGAALRAMLGLATVRAHAGDHAAALGLATRALAELLDDDVLRRSAAELRDAARAQLSADAARQAEERALGLRLDAVLAAFVGPR